MLSIVIVTRNTRQLLETLLVSIEADNALAPTIEGVVVVDNGSTDGTDAMMARRFPRVSYVKNSENRGFAAAVNAGFRLSTGKLVLLLNSDTRLIRGETTRMLDFMEHEPLVGIVGPQLVYENMRPQRSFALTPSLAFEVLPRSLMEKVLPGRFKTKGSGPSKPLDVESLIGAALMVRREVFDLLGGFDERFFLFLEETDFCLRAWEKGRRVVFLPAARVVHLQGKTVGQSWVRGRIEYSISLYKFMGKYHSPGYCALFMLVRAGKALLFLLMLTVLPFLLFSISLRRKYRYYARLLVWHLRGFPESGGLRP